ncbi:MAG: transporter [Flavobacteriales bacterium]|nr:transporter [Flavobacteriales bacterium]
MQNRTLLCCILLIFPITTVWAQYTEELNSNRPGSSQGAFSVGVNVLQFESGVFLGSEEHRLLETETNAFGIDYSVRYGVLKEELEISVMGAFQSNTVTDNRGAIPIEFKQSNFRSNTVGVKYLFYDPYRKMVEQGPNLYSWKANNRFQWRDLIPAMSLYAGANFDFRDNPFTPEPESSISPKVVLSTQNNFIGGFVLVTNIIADRITTDFPSYGYIITLTHTPTDWFSIFVENQGIKSDFYADQLFRGGAAVLITEDLQVDASVLLNIKDTPSRTFGRIGVAYRFDMHDQDEYIEEKGKSGREKRKEKKAKKNKRQDGFEEDDGDGGGLFN